jgi:hypothetical protein
MRHHSSGGTRSSRNRAEQDSFSSHSDPAALLGSGSIGQNTCDHGLRVSHARPSCEYRGWCSERSRRNPVRRPKLISAACANLWLMRRQLPRALRQRGSAGAALHGARSKHPAVFMLAFGSAVRPGPLAAEPVRLGSAQPRCVPICSRAAVRLTVLAAMQLARPSTVHRHLSRGLGCTSNPGAAGGSRIDVRGAST